MNADLLPIQRKAQRPEQPTQIKICGLTRESDVQAASVAEVDFAGFILYARSPRHVSIERARMLVEGLSASVTPVLVLVDADDTDVRAIRDHFSGTDVRYLIQFHGRETPERCAAVSQELNRPYWRAAPVAIGPAQADAAATTQALLDYARPYAEAQALLLDSQVVQAIGPNSHGVGGSGFGGTGHSFDWNLIQWSRLTQNAAFHLVLSGGLNAANVAEGMAKARPWAVDVNSGVEMRLPSGELQKGLKDPHAISAFIAAVRAADAQAAHLPANPHASLDLSRSGLPASQLPTA